MPSLPRGLYEVLLTQLLAEQLRETPPSENAELDDLRNAEAADRVALHLAKVVEAAIETAPEDERAVAAAQLAGRLVDLVASEVKGLAEMRLVEPARMLRAIRKQLPDGSYERVEKPLIPLLDTTLLTNAPGEPRVGHQIRAEIASADRIDLVMAFIRRSASTRCWMRCVRHVEQGKPLRVLTTAYTGSTEARGARGASSNSAPRCASRTTRAARGSTPRRGSFIAIRDTRPRTSARRI